ncbi:DUF2798 domain-containing protein [Paracidovorax wautersii]|uniref:ABC-type transport system involved in cytochrome c biogenesis permease subunit n=1 Tax=Paracidovorax wautersii TaxID=1177982 RepID=A0ABU1IFX8_9BURK|nr:DUF2798 domain-containing protein [Paracidovorax wautersii]MDR6216127.1 ABC-type transport system involved in cytochrome c biogenesis permease subunit [Paracidovorax wautersii]
MTSVPPSAAATPLPADAAPPRIGRLPRKLHRRFAPVVFAFYMAGIMAFLMCCVIVGASGGIDAGYLQRVLKAYALAMPVAFGCVMLVRPVVGRLVAATVHL